MIDGHLHLQDSVLLESIDDIFTELRSLGVEKLVVNATQPGDWSSVKQLAKDFEEVIPFYGLHPWFVNECENGWEEALRGHLEDTSAGVGEIGLDKWIRDHNIEWQKTVFLKQLELAHEFQRPTAIHCLKAWGHLMDCLDESLFDGQLLLHSFSGPKELVKKFVDRGAWFSLSGYFFRDDKADKLEVFCSIPEGRILLETDAPDMLPPDRLIRTRLGNTDFGKPVNHPANLVSVYETYSEWSGVSFEAACARIEENFAAWYSGSDSQQRT